jgi:hypothetical protein
MKITKQNSDVNVELNQYFSFDLFLSHSECTRSIFAMQMDGNV